MKVCFLSGRGCRSFLPATFRNVRFATNDWLYAAAFHRVVKGDRAKHVAMIRHGTGCHAKLLDTLGQWLYLNCAVEEAVIGVQMEMNKSLIRHIDIKRASSSPGDEQNRRKFD